MKKTIITALAVWMGILAGTAAAEEDNTYMAGTLDWNHAKSMAVSFQWDFHHYNDTGFFDFWGLDSEASNRWAPSRIGYELKLPKYFTLELAAGYSGFVSGSSDHPQEDDSVDLEMDTFHFQCSVKRYAPVTDLVSLYGGIGADFVYVDAVLDYQSSEKAYLQESTRSTYGGHALIGVEYRAGKRTSPFSIDLGLEYTLLEAVTLDRELIDTINSNQDADFSSGDLDLGGLTLSTILKYHF